MPRITIRFKDALFGRLVVGAQAAGSTIPDYVRDILNRYEGMDAAGYHDRFDEVQAVLIQVFAILAASVSERRPDILEKGMDDARALLLERGLLDSEEVLQ